MNINPYTKWENKATKEVFLLVEKWGKGFEVTKYKLINLETEEEKLVDKEYMHQIVADGRMVRRISTTKPNPPAAETAEEKKMSKTAKLDWDEAKEIADILTKTENTDDDYSITENALADKWNISLEDFHEIAGGIFQMIDFGISPLTQTPYVGISKGNEWLAKKEVNQQFIHALINWATEGEVLPEGSKGFVRTITSKGKPKFEITISRPKPDVEAVS